MERSRCPSSVALKDCNCYDHLNKGTRELIQLSRKEEVQREWKMVRRLSDEFISAVL
jgi:hypothetical protein